MLVESLARTVVLEVADFFDCSIALEVARERDSHVACLASHARWPYRRAEPAAPDRGMRFGNEKAITTDVRGTPEQAHVQEKTPGGGWCAVGHARTRRMPQYAWAWP